MRTATTSSSISERKSEMRDEKVDIGLLPEEFNKLLKEYGDEVVAIVDEEVESISKETVKMLKKTSPKDSGDYAKGWKAQKKKTNFGMNATVYNSTHGWLAHILEHGHLIRGGGRTKAEPHIKPAEDWASKELLKRIKERLSR